MGELLDIEIEALAAFHPDSKEPWGAWIGACCGTLVRAGLLTRQPYKLTAKGMALLEERKARDD